MQVQHEYGTEFLDLKLKNVENGKIAVDVFAKPTSSFTYVLPTSGYPRKSLNNIPHGIALLLRRIWDTNEKFDSRSIEYKNYLIARDYNPSIGNKYFAHVSTLSRQQVRQKSTNRKSEVNKNGKLIMKYNPRLPDLNSLLKKHMPLLYTDLTLKTIFRQGYIKSVFKRNQSLIGLLEPSLYPSKNVIRTNSATSSNKCDICKNYLVCSNYFACSVTSRRYYTRAVLHCNCNNVIYLITCKNCLEQYAGSATNFKNRFRKHKNDIKTNKDRCRTAKYVNGMRKNNDNIFQFLYIQIIEQVYSNATDIDEILLHSKKYWQSHLFTTTHGINSMTDLYCSKRKDFSSQFTAQKMKLSIKDFFSKCDQIRMKLRIWSHLLKKSLMGNFCAVIAFSQLRNIFNIFR